MSKTYTSGTDAVPLFAPDSVFKDSGTGTDAVPLFRVRPSAVGRENASGPVKTMGWQPDLPDCRDFDLKSKTIKEGLKQVDSAILNSDKPDSRHHNIQYCSPIEDQGALGSCTAQAVVGLMEYMMRRSSNRHIDGSRLFVYKVTRNLLGWTGDTGGYLRTAMQAAAMFGIPPESYFPYDIDRFEEEPSAFLYSFADDFRALNYTRLDRHGLSPTSLLDDIRNVLFSGYCIVFGFSVFSSISNLPDIPFPQAGDSLEGGHAVMAVGYDDGHMVNGKKVPSLIIRNSWGTGWGIHGYGFLPYDYILYGLARDFWTCFKFDWVNTKQFG